MGKIVHVISHTHWDREWYFTVDDSQILMAKGFDEVLSALENNPNIEHYMLDAQASILEEYLRLKPEEFERVKKQVTAGRLITGPWYTQPDVFDVQGESIVRNLLIGMKMAQQLGGGMKIGYLPDSFGFNAQMPYIYAECGLDRAVIRRGYDPDQHGKTEFLWEGLDGRSRVQTSVQPFGYSMGHPRRGARYRDFSLEALVNQTYPLLEKVKQLSSSDHVMLTIGGDQVSMDADFDKFVKLLQENSPTEDTFIQSSLEEYFDSLEPDLPLKAYTGEFRLPRYARVHRTIESSRYDIKQANFLAESALLRYAEPMNAFSKRLGLYHDEVNVERAWKMILESQAHDSMGGCNSDQTNAIVLDRCIRARHIADGVFYHQARLLTRNIPQNGAESVVTIFNGSVLSNAAGTPLSVLSNTPDFDLMDVNGKLVGYTVISQETLQKARKIVYTPEGERESSVDEFYYETTLRLNECVVPPLGYTTLRLVPSTKQYNRLSITEDDWIENETIRVSLVSGHLSYTDKRTNLNLQDLITFEDVADDGDLYDFSPLRHDQAIRSTKARLVSVEKSTNEQLMKLEYEIGIPLKLGADRQGRSSDSVTHVITVELRLVAGEKLQVAVRLKNRSLDHRLRILFHTSINSTESLSDLPFGVMQRQQHGIPDDWHDRYDEYPANIEPFMSRVSIRDDQSDFTLMAKGNKEYEVTEPGVLAITLFRSVGAIGKADLLYRPGRESGRCVQAPEAQLLKPLSFSFCIGVSQVVTDLDNQINQTAERFANPFRAYQAQDLKRDFQQMDYFDIYVPEAEVPDHMSLIKAVPEGFGFSSLTTYNGQALLRLTNLSGKSIDVDADSIVEGSQLTNFAGSDARSTDTVPNNSAITIAMK